MPWKHTGCFNWTQIAGVQTTKKAGGFSISMYADQRYSDNNGPFQQLMAAFHAMTSRNVAWVACKYREVAIQGGRIVSVGRNMVQDMQLAPGPADFIPVTHPEQAVHCRWQPEAGGALEFILNCISPSLFDNKFPLFGFMEKFNVFNERLNGFGQYQRLVTAESPSIDVIEPIDDNGGARIRFLDPIPNTWAAGLYIRVLRTLGPGKVIANPNPYRLTLINQGERFVNIARWPHEETKNGRARLDQVEKVSYDPQRKQVLGITNQKIGRPFALSRGRK